MVEEDREKDDCLLLDNKQVRRVHACNCELICKNLLARYAWLQCNIESISA